MKTATIPALRVEPKLREAVESVLADNETLSSFVEESLRANIEKRIHQQAFIARGLASRDEAKRTGEYYSAEGVLAELAGMLKNAQQGCVKKVSYQIRFTKVAREDIKRLYVFLVEHDKHSADQALEAINKAIELLKTFPFTCRKAQIDNPFMRELIISFGANGYVALFEIEENNIVTILALRHQREDDYR